MSFFEEIAQSIVAGVAQSEKDRLRFLTELRDMSRLPLYFYKDNIKFTNVNIEDKISELMVRKAAIDKEQEVLREERKQVVIKIAKLERSLKHVNEVLGGKVVEVKDDGTLLIEVDGKETVE